MKDGYTHICLVVDRSGSMYNIVGDMNGAIKQMMKDQAEQPGHCLVDVITFDTVVDVVHDNAYPGDITEDVIEPRGSTALNDAIGLGIMRMGNKFRLMPEEERPENVVFVIVTDGMENASQEYTNLQVKRLVEQQTNQYNWTFLYLAANVDAFATGRGYGFNDSMVLQYGANAQGAGASFAAASAGVTRTRSGLDANFTDAEREAAEGK